MNVRRSKMALVSAVGVLSFAAAEAAVANPFTVVFEVKDTDVQEEVLELPGNPCQTDLGEELIEVTVSATLRGLGSLAAENLSESSTADVTLRHELLSSTIDMPSLPGGGFGINASAGPFEEARTLAIYDGTNDFNGASGFKVETYCCDLETDSQTYTSAADLAAFNSAFDVVFTSDGEDSTAGTSGNVDTEIITRAGGEATVAYTCRTPEPELVCNFKTMTTPVGGSATASFRIANPGDVDFTDLTIVDTMGDGMSLVSGSATSAPDIGQPTEAPVGTYTWNGGISLPAGSAVEVAYEVAITGDTCNTVVASTAEYGLSTSPSACTVCVETPPDAVPAIGPWGLALLGGGLAGLGGLAGRRRLRGRR